MTFLIARGWLAMIIDLNTQVWANLDQLGKELAGRVRKQSNQIGGSIDGSSAAHERAATCVDGSVILGFRSQLLGAHIPNEFVAEYVAKDPSRRVGIAGIDPMSDDCIDQIDAAVGLGLAGIAVSPTCQGFHPSHSDAMKVYERCADLSLPLFVITQQPLTPAAQLEFARPASWDEVARALPKLPIVISQLGHPWIDETLLLLSKHECVFADISLVASRPWQLYNALLNAFSMEVMDKLLFGSGFPLETPARAIESLYTVNAFSHGTQLPSVARASIRSIVERDSLACLGIDSEITAASHRADLDEDEAMTLDDYAPADGRLEESSEGHSGGSSGGNSGGSSG